MNDHPEKTGPTPGRAARVILGGIAALGLGAAGLTVLSAYVLVADESCATLSERAAALEQRVRRMDVYLNNARVLNTPAASRKAPSPEEYRAAQDDLEQARRAFAAEGC